MSPDIAERARAVVRIAGRSRECPAAARIIRGAINDCYERLAADTLTATAARAAELGMDEAEHDAAVASHLLLCAAEARLRMK